MPFPRQRRRSDRLQRKKQTAKLRTSNCALDTRAAPGTLGGRVMKQALVTLDMEGVLTPEIWIAVAEKTGIPELRRTTRDEPDYDVLMRGRLAILDRHGLKLSDIQAVIAGLPLLDQTDAVTALAEELMKSVPIPPRAAADAVHIATAAVHGMQYLLTWNCTHIANVSLRPRIEAACRAARCEPPLICTPPELPLPEETP